MASIDENVEVGVELTTSTLRLTGRAIVAIMDLFLDKDKDTRKEYTQDLTNKQGKQKLKNLFTKYENTGVQSLGNNLSKEERKFIEKELKSMGVDFSIRKIGENDYSLFFAGKDIEAIEKGMENAINKYAKREQRNENKKEKTRSNEKEEEPIKQQKQNTSKEKSNEEVKEKTKKPKFDMDSLQKKHTENKQKQRKEMTQDKVKNKVPKRSL